MALNKRKILESARKLAQKGSKEKALAEYQKLLKLDPKDAKLRLEIGDAHRRWGQVEQAVETYTRVAEQYMGEGFDARAVAVFKQILNLDPDCFDAYAPLAELYERMGLTAEAISALQTAADGFHRQGRKDEALGLLRKMANADPSNTTSRIKVADLLRQQDKTDDAIAEYQLAAEELERQGDVETLGTVYRRILEADQTHVHALHQLAKNLAARGKVSEAVPLAERAVQLDDANPDHYELLADLFERTNRPGDRDKAIRGLAEVYRQRGDEDRARDLLQRAVPSSDLLGDDPTAEDGDLFGDQFPDTEGAPELAVDFGNDVGLDPGSSASGLSMGPMLDEESEEDEPEELLLEEVAAPPPAAKPAPAAKPTTAAAPSDDLDVDQLLAEAAVYLRYGKRDKAIAHLERVVEEDPGHRGGLEKLGEAFAESGDNERAVEHWLRAARGAMADGDEEAVRVLRGRIAVLDEAAAATLEGDGGAPDVAAVSAAAPLDDLGIDVDVDDDDLLLEDDDELLEDADLGDPIAAPDDRLEIEVPESAAPELSLDASDDAEIGIDLSEDGDAEIGIDPSGDHELEIGIDLDDASFGAAPDEASQAGADPGLLEDEGPGAADAEIEMDLDGDLGEAAADDAPEERLAPAASSGQSLSASAKQQVLDDLEEADFYIQQGLHEEAEGIYRRILEAAPGHPRALLRLGEIAAARGDAPVTPTAVDGDATPVPDIDLDDEDAYSVEVADASEPLDPVADAGPITTPEAPSETAEVAPEPDLSAPTPSMEVPDEVVAALDLDDDASEPGIAAAAPATDEDGATDGSDTQELRPAAASTEALPPAGTAVSPAIEGAEGDFDLAAALVDAFDDDDSGIFGSGPAGDGFEAVFSAFKKGVSETLSEGDHQAHYDLAIAYKEMGLLDDAINELRTAMADPGRTAECLHLIGLCAIDADQAPLAVEHLEQLLDLPGLDVGAVIAARFDLGRALEAVGDLEGARREWQLVVADAPDFQNVSQRLAGLGQPKPEPAASEDEGLESFDGFMDGLDDDEGDADDDGFEAHGGEPAELILEDEVEPADAILQGEPLEDVESSPDEPSAEPAAPQTPAPRPKPAAKRKKKKISFL